jgi:hypothetical protein
MNPSHRVGAKRVVQIEDRAFGRHVLPDVAAHDTHLLITAKAPCSAHRDSRVKLYADCPVVRAIAEEPVDDTALTAPDIDDDVIEAETCSREERLEHLVWRVAEVRVVRPRTRLSSAQDASEPQVEQHVPQRHPRVRESAQKVPWPCVCTDTYLPHQFVLGEVSGRILRRYARNARAAERVVATAAYRE